MLRFTLYIFFIKKSNLEHSVTTYVSLKLNFCGPRRSNVFLSKRAGCLSDASKRSFCGYSFGHFSPMVVIMVTGRNDRTLRCELRSVREALEGRLPWGPSSSSSSWRIFLCSPARTLGRGNNRQVGRFRLFFFFFRLGKRDLHSGYDRVWIRCRCCNQRFSISALGTRVWQVNAFSYLAGAAGGLRENLDGDSAAILRVSNKNSCTLSLVVYLCLLCSIQRERER